MRVRAVSDDKENGVKNSFRYFENRDCKYYPCHKMEHINCLFCYCPLYSHDCPGNYEMREIRGRMIKVCTDCTYPHEAENYPEIIRILSGY